MERASVNVGRTPLPEHSAPCHEGRSGGCGSCGDCGVGRRFLCHCLRVTETQVLDVLSRFTVRTVKELRQLTGAGDGCTACHRLLARYIERFAQSPSSSSAEPICSVR